MEFRVIMSFVTNIDINSLWLYNEVEISKFTLKEYIPQLLVKELVLLEASRFNVDENQGTVVELTTVKENKMSLVEKITL